MSAPIASADPTTARTPTPHHHPRVLAAVWRMHRTVLLTCAGLAAVLFGLLIALRLRSTAIADHARATAVECRGAGAGTVDCAAAVDSVVYNALNWATGILTIAVVGSGLVTGALAGAPVFAREFEQRTQVWALTQSVGRTRWWAAKIVVVLVFVALIMLPVSAVADWSLDGIPYSDRSMEPDIFLSRRYVPTVIALVATSIGLTAGIYWRSTVAAILTVVVVATGSLVGGEFLRPHMITADRYEQPAGDYASVPVSTDVWWVAFGYLDATGRTVEWSGICPEWNTATGPGMTMTEEQSEQITGRCMAADGIVAQYNDAVPTSRFGLLRAVWSGWALLLSGLVLVAGLLRVRRRVV